MDLSNWLICIPARLESTRLEQKMLQDLCGKPLIARVYENIQSLERKGAKIVVATDSEKILDCLVALGVPVELTSKHHLSGTDRCYEVATKHQRPWVLNVQGDEPFISTQDILSLMRSCLAQPEIQMATMYYKVDTDLNKTDKSHVKVVISKSLKALYFSRAPIPSEASHASREETNENYKESGYNLHMGIYAYRQGTLQRLIELPASPLEKIEKLEQLRALENDIPIHCLQAEHHSKGIDTLEDLENARRVFSSRE